MCDKKGEESFEEPESLDSCISSLLAVKSFSGGDSLYDAHTPEMKKMKSKNTLSIFASVCHLAYTHLKYIFISYLI